jgi:hypothetical protein
MGWSRSAAGWRRAYVWLGQRSVWPYLFVVGVVLLGFGAFRANHIIGCAQWPTVTGEVVSCELVRGLMREGVAQASLAMTYAYRVNGVAYEGHRISYAGNKADYEAIRAMLKRYRQGTAVTIFHHPGNPAHAVLDPTYTWRGFKPLLYGLGSVGVAIMGILRGWRLTSAGWFNESRAKKASSGKMSFEDFLLGLLGFLTIVCIPFLWWALIKLYAGH